VETQRACHSVPSAKVLKQTLHSTKDIAVEGYEAGAARRRARVDS
jgi:hypothetical protein